MLGERLLYFAAMICATVLAGYLVRKSQRNLEIAPLQRFGILAGALIGAMFAGKLPFVMQNAELGMGSWLSDGKTILWALAGGYIGVEVAKWSLNVKVRTGDTFVVPVALAVAIGRLGCLLFGCCYGIPTDLPWGICFITAEDGGTISRHPTQLYESLFHLSFALIAIYAIRKEIWRGNLMPVYIATYSIYRFGSEFIRPEPRIWSGFTFYQLSSVPIGLCMIGIVIWRIIGSKEVVKNEVSPRVH